MSAEDRHPMFPMPDLDPELPPADAEPDMVTFRLTRGSAIRLEQHLTRHFGEGRLVQEIRDAFGGPEPSGPGLLFVLDATQAAIVQEFIEGKRRAAANPEERKLLKRLRVFAEEDQPRERH